MSNSIVNMMGSGLPAAASTAISGNIATGLTAAGSTQGTALAISANYNVCTTVALNTGVILPSSAQPSDEIEVFNLGANSLSVYPPTGAAINSLSANAAQAVAAGKGARFVCISPTQWVTVVSA